MGHTAAMGLGQRLQSHQEGLEEPPLSTPTKLLRRPTGAVGGDMNIAGQWKSCDHMKGECHDELGLFMAGLLEGLGFWLSPAGEQGFELEPAKAGGQREVSRMGCPQSRGKGGCSWACSSHPILRGD